MSFRADFAHKERLIEAAIDEFVEAGYGKASLNRILARAGVSKGQFYHHFANKQALYLGLVELMIDRKRAFMVSADPPDDGDDFFDRLRAQLQIGLSFARADPRLERFSRSFLRERGRPIHAAVLERFPLGRGDALGAMVDAALAASEFTDELSSAFVRRAVGVVMTHSAELLDAESTTQLEDGLDELIAFLRRALGR